MSVKFSSSRGNFSSYGGLGLFSELVSSSSLSRRLKEYLPVGKRRHNIHSDLKFKTLLYAFGVGGDCLEDIDTFAKDVGFQAVCKNRVYKSGVYGNFLRSFDGWQIRGLDKVLRDSAFELRRRAFPEDRDFILDVDSTFHVQYGRKMEGLAFDYEKKWGLSSLQAFDQHGIQYAMKVREGNTFTSVGTAEVVRQVFSHMPRKYHRFMRGDSGMCNFDVMNACIENDVDFVLAMRANMYRKIKNAQAFWHWKQSEIKTRDGRECEITCAPYHPRGFKKAMRVVLIRAKKKNPDMFEKFDHYGWVTNIGTSEKSDEEIIEFYKKRGNAENFIKELKNGYDIHHFPCQKLSANKVYGIIGALAMNFMRVLGRIMHPQGLIYSKKIRFNMIYIGAQVVKKSRYTFMKISKHKFKEVAYWLSKIKRQVSYT